MRLLFVGLFLILSVGCGNKDASPELVGPSGVAGKNALPCTVTAVDGGAIISCPDGSSQSIMSGSQGAQGLPGLPGQDGAPGNDGQNGQNGADGQPGAPGTSVVPVKLCSQYETVYPTSFPEYGLCIADNLYAVYWNGTQAFAALIPPGNYVSTSPQACSFTVSAHCQVVSQ